MTFAVPHLKIDPAIRRFIIWMMVGTAFILTLVAAEYFSGGGIF